MIIELKVTGATESELALVEDHVAQTHPNAKPTLSQGPCGVLGHWHKTWEIDLKDFPNVRAPGGGSDRRIWRYVSPGTQGQVGGEREGQKGP